MMNAAFRRSEALVTLENYAPTIVAHLALLQFFPDHTACNHWCAELATFEKVIRRYNKGKKGSSNLNPDMIQKSLEDEMFCADDEERIESYIHAKGLPLSEDPDWNLVRKAIHEFAQRFR